MSLLRSCFIASVVALFDTTEYRGTDGVGPRLTPDAQLPRWCPRPRDCKNAARRQPKAILTCALAGCKNTLTVAGKSNRLYCTSEHRTEAARLRRAANRAPVEPSVEFTLADEVIEDITDILGLDPTRTARREAADAETAVRHAAEEVLRLAQALLAETEAKAIALDAEQAPVSTASARLAALDAELDASAKEREYLSDRLLISMGPFHANIHDADQVKARLDELNALAANRP